MRTLLPTPGLPRHCRTVGASAALAVLLVSPMQAAEPAPGMASLYRLDRLAAFKGSVTVASQSSYDRTGGNNDGFSGTYSFVRREPGGLVLLDVTGPGVIHRIWTPTPTDDVVEFYFDGESKPRLSLPFRDLFTGAHEAFVRPLVGSGAGGFYSYVPLPFAKSCKGVIKADNVQFYQINYSTYPETASVKTFAWPLTDEDRKHRDAACKLFASAGQDVTEFIAGDSPAVVVQDGRQTLQPGKSCTLFETDRPGRIIGLRLSPASALAGKDRGIVLRAYWDGDSQPAINVPVGDLFGYAWGQPATRALLVGTTDGDVNYLYFPMPFDKSAKIELVSEQADAAPIEVEANVITQPIARTADEGKFYALWRRENPTTKGKPFTFIETEGRGHIVGCFQQAQGLESGNTLFFEGDDQTTIDGELAIHGTGSEDFYNGGWYDVPGRWETRRSFPLSGCLGYQKHLGRTGGYRLMLNDAYAYRKSIVQTIEHAPERNEMINDYCGLTLLYSAERPTCSFELPSLEDRRVVDPKRIVFALWWNNPIYAWAFQNASLERTVQRVGGDETRLLSLVSTGGDAFGEPFISFICEIPAAGRYRISLRAAEGPQQGTVQLFHDESPVAEGASFYAEEPRLGKPKPLGELALEEGPNNVLIKLVGKPQGAKHRRLDARELICERIDE
ncbi:MAG: hypothetical protein DCC67_18535 [Planctomycetota bacterium]|nr:MAG: hypothetical protein DCC67_18535 [Planctomycetota bacterium]